MSQAGQGPASLIGQVVGGYRLERVVGKGATCAVGALAEHCGSCCGGYRVFARGTQEYSAAVYFPP